MKLPPFIGMAFNQLPLGICPWFLQWGPPITAVLHLPTSYYPIHFNVSPSSLPFLHKYNQACQERQSHSLAPSIVSDWLFRAAVAPSSHPHLSWLHANRSSPILPTPTLWPDRGAHPALHHSALRSPVKLASSKTKCVCHKSKLVKLPRILTYRFRENIVQTMYGCIERQMDTWTDRESVTVRGQSRVLGEMLRQSIA